MVNISKTYRDPATFALPTGTPNTLFDYGYTGHVSEDNILQGEAAAKYPAERIPVAKRIGKHLDDFGLINMTGRVYDPALGRFLSPDNPMQNPYNLQNYNRYSYCVNNPLIYTDPSGEIPIFIPIIAGAVIGGYLGGSAAEGWEMNPGNWAWDGDTWAGIGMGAVIGAAGGYGFGVGAPALANTGFFAHFGTSGTVAAYTLMGGAAGGAIGYGSGFSGGMLYSNGDWGYSHQSGIFGAKVGATIGTVAGAIAGTIESYEQPKSPPSLEMPDKPKWEGPFFQGSKEEAKELLLGSSKLFNVETSYWETSRGYYFAPISGNSYTFNPEARITLVAKKFNLDNGYKINTIGKTFRYTYLEKNGNCLYICPNIFHRAMVYSKAHTHPNNNFPGSSDLLVSKLLGIQCVVYGWSGITYKYGGYEYWK